MANESETLTFRIRAIAENLGVFRKTAKASDEVNTSMEKSAKLSEKLVGAEKKLTVARNQHADALGKVRVAEIKVNEIRGNTAAKTSQIAAAEERLLTARRNAARSGSELQRIESEFRNTAAKSLVQDSEKAGRDSGKGFIKGFLGRVKGDSSSGNFASTAELVGASFAGGIGNGLRTALQTQAGPLIIGALVAAVAVGAPAIGAVLAGGIVAAFGAGIATLGIVFAAKADAVRTKWANTMSQMGRDAQLLSKPFESVLIRIADIAARTFASFAPLLQVSFARLAGPIQTFASDVGRAFEELRPVIPPITDAFIELLKALGPGFQAAMKSTATGLIAIADSVRKNPQGFADAVAAIGDFLEEVLQIIAVLNDANGAFERLTGGISLVEVAFGGLVAGLDTLAAPLVFLAKYIGFVSDAINALKHGTDASGTSMSDAANKTALLAQGLQKTGGAAGGAGGPVKTFAEQVAESDKQASNAARAYEDMISQMFRLQNLSISLAQAQIQTKSAFAQAAAAVRENGRATNLNTAAGRENYQALVDAAKATNTQTEAMTRAGKSNLSTAKTAEANRDKFIKLARQMGYSQKEAQKMAADMIAIPNVDRRARLTAEKQDLDRKLADARRQLKDPNLTKERRAQINANIKKLTDQLRKAQAQINGLKGKTVEIKYTSNGVNLTTPSRVGGVATGAKIRGPGSDTSDRAGVFALSNNEWVIKAKSSRKYGDYAMQSVNDGTATIIPGMATGGKATVGIHSRGLFNSVEQGRAILMRMLGGPALAFAKSQVGKPYVWGGVGPGGYDCSGFMSAITNVIQGKNPYHRRFATGSLPAGLFDRGPGRFEIGWFRGNPGHTAGTLNGTNVESRGGRGVVVGPGARGARDRLFNSGVYHLRGYARGGKVAGDPPYDGFAEWLQGLKSYATGTPFVPQDGLAFLHRGEKVTPAAQNNAPARVLLEFRSDGSPYMEFLIREFRKFIRATYGGDVEAALGGRRG